MEQFMCGFCLNEVEAPEYPGRCDRCEMVRCTSCATWVQQKDEKPVKFCYGCGTVSPETRVAFCRTSSTASCYVVREWQRRNLGSGRETVYSVAIGWKTDEDRKSGKPKSAWVVKETNSGYEDVRELTDEEKEALKGE